MTDTAHEDAAPVDPWLSGHALISITSITQMCGITQSGQQKCSSLNPWASSFSHANDAADSSSERSTTSWGGSISWETRR